MTYRPLAASILRFRRGVEAGRGRLPDFIDGIRSWRRGRLRLRNRHGDKCRGLDSRWSGARHLLGISRHQSARSGGNGHSLSWSKDLGSPVRCHAPSAQPLQSRQLRRDRIRMGRSVDHPWNRLGRVSELRQRWRIHVLREGPYSCARPAVLAAEPRSESPDPLANAPERHRIGGRGECHADDANSLDTTGRGTSIPFDDRTAWRDIHENRI
jgi:hypothetical protein